MQAHVGDHVVVEAGVLDTTPRRGRVLAVLGDDVVRYRVRWEDGHESVLRPGPDVHLVHVR
ncbi:DUF1918 domain-containing protein [Pseudonocardia xishanensis]|uniref:DUF1918 domain-containing protein n=1 Tax=Pseudonocardia xishanensis TaxID=630995 RepID=A0ABP8RWP8_9PSEU